MLISVLAAVSMAVIHSAVSHYHRMMETTRFARVARSTFRVYNQDGQKSDWGELKRDLQSQGFEFREGSLLPLDRWGHEIKIRILLRDAGQFRIVVTSPGKDGVMGTDDDILYDTN